MLGGDQNLKKGRLILTLLLCLSLVLPLPSLSSLTDSGITFGPYLQRLTNHGVSILLRTDTDQTLTLYYQKEGADRWQSITETEADTQHRFRLTSLKRNTRYVYYLAVGDERLTQNYDFSTNKDITATNPLRIAVFGDSGVASTTQYEVASEISVWEPDLLLHTGDIAYDSGTEQELIDKFFIVYSSLLSRRPFYGSIGNHDYTTNEAEAYKALFETPRHSGNEDYYSFNYDTVHLVSLNSNLDFSVGSDMYTWLANDLAKASDQTWSIVFFHHPVYSTAEHGNTSGMAESLAPLFAAQGVDVVLNGHDHDYERFYPIDDVHYIVTGGGGNTTYQQITPSEQSAVFLAENHFVGLLITDEHIKLQAIDEDGFVFDHITIKP